MAKQFILKGTIVSKSKGVYDKLAKCWKITWTVRGKVGPLELDSACDTEKTMTFETRGPGQRYAQIRDRFHEGDNVTVIYH